MTGPGTNSYLLGEDRLVVIDPGPAIARHHAALLAAIGGRKVEAILVTHAHLDHSALARDLARATGAPVVAYGSAGAGRSPVMERLAASGLAGGGEGVDLSFRPDIAVSDGATLPTDLGPVTALHMPGHMGNHLCFRWGDRVFSGDLVMAWSTTLISPPDGDLSQFVSSCRRLAATGAAMLLPGHGGPVADPAARIAELLAHRASRSDQIRAALAEGPDTAAGLAARLYAGTPRSLLPAAARNVLAHLIDLESRGEVRATPSLGAEARFALA
jgi:hydroxyacylglutathione hydrolase